MTPGPGRRPNAPKDAFAAQKVTPKPVKKERKVIAENFNVGDKILCLHVASAIHYEAKITDEQTDPTQTRSFRVHYQGWNKRYDEDVTFDDVPFRFNFYTDSSAAEAKEAQRAAIQNSARKKARRDRDRADRDRTGTPTTSLAGSALEFPGTATSSRSTTPDFRRKHRAGSYTSSENVPPRKAPKPRRSDSNKLEGDVVTIFSQPPPNLVEVLVIDKRKILEGFMVKIPEEYTVDHIVDLYVEKIRNESQHVNADMFIEYDNVVTLEHTTAEMQKHIAYFIKDLFNHILKTSLLYGPEKKEHERRLATLLTGKEVRSSERKHVRKRSESESSQSQASEVEEDHPKFSSYYGSVHLLRMMARFMDYIPQLTASPTSLELGLATAQDFMVFLSKNIEDFVNSESDYVEMTTK